MFENNPIKAALFDLDGTLAFTNIDFDELRTIAYNHAEDRGFRKENIPVEDIIGIVHYVRDSLDMSEGQEFQKIVFKAFEAKEALYCKHPLPANGASELLSLLASKNIKTAVVTRNSGKIAENILRLCNLKLDAVISRDSVRYVKPNPEHLLHALKRLGAPPSSAVMIGDHITDIQAAHASGCISIGVMNGIRTRSYFESCKPTIVATDLCEIIHIIKSQTHQHL